MRVHWTRLNLEYLRCCSIRRCALMAALGGLTSIAVAWVCAVTSTFMPGRAMRLDGDKVWVDRLTPDQNERSWWANHAPQEFAKDIRIVSTGAGPGIIARLFVASDDRLITFRVESLDLSSRSGLNRRFVRPGWSIEINRLGEDAQKQALTVDRALVIEAGWPLRCLRGIRWEGSVAPRVSFYIENANLSKYSPDSVVYTGALPVSSGDRLLPMVPIWHTFALNVAVYALTIRIGFVGLAAIRRGLRQRRGLCTNCGYDLQTSPSTRCPECGRQG